MARMRLIYKMDAAPIFFPKSSSACGRILAVFPEDQALSPGDVRDRRASVIKDISEQGLLDIENKKFAVNRITPEDPLIPTDPRDHIVEPEIE